MSNIYHKIFELILLQIKHGKMKVKYLKYFFDKEYKFL